jgi:hypothetical protein
MNKTLLLLDRDDDLFARMSAKGNIDVRRAYDTKSIILKIIRRAHLVSKLPFFSVWNGSWKTDLKSYDTVIIHASNLKAPIVYYIHKHEPRIRVILWYWNPVATTVNPNSIPDKYCEKWSFDPSDCKKYNMKYNSQFYFKEIKISKKKVISDVLFVGKDKGRYEKLVTLKDNLLSRGVVTDFLIMPDNQRSRLYGKKYSPRLSYSKILDKISQSRSWT